jgi:hypothetical protein
MKAKELVVHVAIAVTTSVIVALVIEAMRAKGIIPAPTPRLPTPVAPGHDHV